MANSKVPKFGGWNSGDNVGYTAFFESARKGKAGGTSPIRNPNEMFLNSDMESAPAPPRSPPQPANRPTTTTSSKPTPPKQQQQQPKFGVWNEDAEEDIPYTAYFENTTKTKTNPNEPPPPRMNRDMAAATASTPAAAAATSKPSTKQQQQPKFGVWNEEEEEDIPYTAYFENTTNTKTNPNEPPARMNRDMVGATAATSKPTTKQQQQQPKFGEWNEEAPYTAYFENNTKKDNIHAPKSSTEPQMNRDMVTPTPAISRPDPRANEQQMGHGGGRGGGGGEGRRGGRQQQVQFASGGRSSAEPSPLHNKAGGGRSNGGSSNIPPKKSPLHYAAQQGPTVPPFGNWGKEENYSEVFGQINKEGTPPGRGYNNASPYHHRSNPQNNQTKKQPKCGFLSWLCP